MKRTKLFGMVKASDTEKLLEKINIFNRELEKMEGSECFVQEFHLQFPNKMAIVNFKIPEDKADETLKKLEEINKRS